MSACPRPRRSDEQHDWRLALLHAWWGRRSRSGCVFLGGSRGHGATRIRARCPPRPARRRPPVRYALLLVGTVVVGGRQASVASQYVGRSEASRQRNNESPVDLKFCNLWSTAPLLFLRRRGSSFLFPPSSSPFSSSLAPVRCSAVRSTRAAAAPFPFPSSSPLFLHLPLHPGSSGGAPLPSSLI